MKYLFIIGWIIFFCNPIEAQIMVLKNKNEIIPIKHLNKESIAYINLTENNIKDDLLNYLQKFTQINKFYDVNQDFSKQTLFIININKNLEKNQSIKNKIIELNKKLNHKKIIFILSEHPENIKLVSKLKNKSIIYSDKFDLKNQIEISEIIFGANDCLAKNTDLISNFYNKKTSLETKSLNRLGFDLPENVEMNPKELSKIDSIIKDAISKKVFPGAQVLVARKSKIIYHETFGFHTYENKQKVEQNNLYDVASLTKIIATMPLMIKLYKQKKYKLEDKLGDLITDFKGSNKENITTKELLSHYGKLQAFKNFYKNTLNPNGTLNQKYYLKDSTEKFNLKIAENIFLKSDYKDSIFTSIKNTSLIPKKEYKYSDFTFIIAQQYIENTLKNNLDKLIKENFFYKLGMNNSTFNPLNKFGKDLIIPTEIDDYYRHQIIQGYVHDMNAAMKGGISGHAGLFSTANDIAKMMQMYLNKGIYADDYFFSQKTFDDFNTCYFCSEGNPRVLGFDKKREKGSTSEMVSEESFGHTGFTGTMTWADPKYDLIYVFLSNRTFPNFIENTLVKQRIREKIQDIIYNSIIK